MLLHELVQAVKRYGQPTFLRTDNEAVLISRLFRLGLWVLGIQHQQIEPGCPWQNGRVERFIGTVKRELRNAPVTDGNELATTLQDIRTWYNHDRPHDHLRGRTPAEVWAGIDVFAAKPGSQTGKGSAVRGEGYQQNQEMIVRRGLSAAGSLRRDRAKR